MPTTARDTAPHRKLRVSACHPRRMPGITAQAAERAVFELAAEREPQIVAQRGRILRDLGFGADAIAGLRAAKAI